MADSEQFILQDHNFNEGGENVASTNEMGVSNGTELTDQIIQEALQGVSEPMQQNVVQYTTESGENLTLIANGSVLTDVSGNVVGTLNEDGTTYTLLNNLNIPESSPSQQQSLADVISSTNELKETESLLKSETSLVKSETSLLKSETSLISVADNKDAVKSESAAVTVNNAQQQQPLYVIRSSSVASVTEPSATTEPVTQDLPSVNVSVQSSFPTLKGAPLGSSQNPIRIIQQGNHYTSTQQLNPDQLAQIMQVIQEQQAVRQAKQMGGPSVVYNPHTQTKIVYRVINPSDLHTKPPVSSPLVIQPNLERSYTGKRRGRKRKSDTKNEDEDASQQGPELSNREKEEKKKMRPKTRSGLFSHCIKVILTA